MGVVCVVTEWAKVQQLLPSPATSLVLLMLLALGAFSRWTQSSIPPNLLSWSRYGFLRTCDRASSRTDQPGEKRAITTGRLAIGTPLHVSILQNQLLIRLELLPGYVSGMMVFQQNIPCGHRGGGGGR
jgi:hypothetical protein